MSSVLNIYYPNTSYPHSERVRIRREVSAVIGNDPINGARYYRTEVNYNSYHTNVEGKDFYKDEIIYNIKRSNGHIFFDYYDEKSFDVGL